MNRKEFLRLAGCAGAGAATFGALDGRAAAASIKCEVGDLPKEMDAREKSHRQQFNMSGFAAPRIDTVRIGIIGTDINLENGGGTTKVLS